ncbi:uncharacterized protein LOC133456211 [Cololabis saira]|uniref:uncharacterized protein LOC133456211 n=1 Tax=Cololabis saira TaxID=129043 RepID=UPI002AD44B8C|nr:uncharacterized protein LOC133456211 [Cololabis saira]
MALRGKHLTATIVLIIVTTVFSVQTLTCQLYEYQTGNKCCPRCNAGSRVQTDCTDSITTSCLPCEDGTFMDKPNGLKKCHQCTNCDLGSGLKVMLACSPASDTVCEPVEGFFCIDSGGRGCTAAQKHRSCEPGQYIRERDEEYDFLFESISVLRRSKRCSVKGIYQTSNTHHSVPLFYMVIKSRINIFLETIWSQNDHLQMRHCIVDSSGKDNYQIRSMRWFVCAGNASSDTECSDCSSGTFSDGTLTSCQPHTQCETNHLQVIKAGTASTDAECGEQSFTTPILAGVVSVVFLCLVVVALIIYRKKIIKYKHERVGTGGKVKQNGSNNIKQRTATLDGNEGNKELQDLT